MAGFTLSQSGVARQRTLRVERQPGFRRCTAVASSARCISTGVAQFLRYLAGVRTWDGLATSTLTRHTGCDEVPIRPIQHNRSAAPPGMIGLTADRVSLPSASRNHLQNRRWIGLGVYWLGEVESKGCARCRRQLVAVCGQRKQPAPRNTEASVTDVTLAGFRIGLARTVTVLPQSADFWSDDFESTGTAVRTNPRGYFQLCARGSSTEKSPARSVKQLTRFPALTLELSDRQQQPTSSYSTAATITKRIFALCMATPLVNRARACSITVGWCWRFGRLIAVGGATTQKHFGSVSSPVIAWKMLQYKSGSRRSLHRGLVYGKPSLVELSFQWTGQSISRWMIDGWFGYMPRARLHFVAKAAGCAHSRQHRRPLLNRGAAGRFKLSSSNSTADASASEKWSAGDGWRVDTLLWRRWCHSEDKQDGGRVLEFGDPENRCGKKATGRWRKQRGRNAGGCERCYSQAIRFSRPNWRIGWNIESPSKFVNHIRRKVGWKRIAIWCR